MDMIESKQVLRRRVLDARAQLSPAEWEEKSCLAQERLLSLDVLRRCRTVMAFYPFREEIDTRRFLEEARNRGQNVWLPLAVPSERRLIPMVYTGEQTLRTGAYGIREPDPALCSPGEPEQLEAVIVPGVAFDAVGGRTGYGGGYYDRFLASLPVRPLLIGFGFSLQVVERVPAEPHDVRLDFLVTEEGIFGPFSA